MRRIYRGLSSPGIHTPGVYRWAMRAEAATLTQEARDIGAKMYLLADLFPGLPSTVLGSIARGVDLGEANGVSISIEGDVVVIEYEDSQPTNPTKE